MELSTENVPKELSTEDLPSDCGGSSSEYELSDFEYFSPSCDETNTETHNEPSLASDLLTFYITFNISVAAMKFLLNTLTKHKVANVPKSLYRLKKLDPVENNNTIQELQSGRFAYIGVTENLRLYLHRNQELLKTQDLLIRTKVNIDGLPLYRSSPLSLWPILMTFNEDIQPYPIAMHLGYRKPDLDDFIAPFIREVSNLQSEGVVIKKSSVKVSDVVFVCDAPARAHIQCVLGHASKKGCAYCRNEGVSLEDRIVFSSSVGEPRNDVSYQRMQENNQTRLSPITAIAGLHSDFPIEELHCVCLGVFRRMCYFYFSKVKSFTINCRLRKVQVDLLSQELKEIRNYTPSEFQRKPRPLNTDLVHYKGTEFRSLLLYFGPFLFKKYLSENAYNHFMLLHFAYYVFSSDRFSAYYNQAHRCLEIFVRQYAEFFGAHSISYNVHSLLHLHEFVIRFGPLGNFSAFRFENYLGRLKRRVKVTRYIFSHVMEQVLKLRYLSKASTHEIIFSDNAPNNVALVEQNVILVDELFPNGIVGGRKLIFRKDLFTYPYRSQQLGIGCYAVSRIVVKGKPNNKAIGFPHHNEIVVFPYV